MHFKVAVRKSCNQEREASCYEGVQCMYCGCKMNREVTLGLPYAISLQHQSKPLTTTVSPVCLQPGQPLCMWLKQPTCFCSAGPLPLTVLEAMESWAGSGNKTSCPGCCQRRQDIENLVLELFKENLVVVLL